MKKLTIALALLMTLSSPLVAQDFQKGLTAYEAGDYSTAFKELLPLAEQGNAQAQFIMSEQYRRGRGVLQDFDEGMRWRLLAASQGLTTAYNKLGELYELGYGGVDKDLIEAVKWYRLSADQGDAEGQYQLAFAYMTGQGVKQDSAKSKRLHRLAAMQGLWEAHHMLGWLYQRGKPGYLQDNLMAHMWFNIASATATEDAPQRMSAKERATVAEKMTPADISKAQAMARECMSSGYKKCGY